MATTPDTLFVVGPVFAQANAGTIYVTPAGGTQDVLANLVNGGTVAKSGLFSSLVVGSNTLATVSNFSSIVPGGSTAAQATPATGLFTLIGTAASTAGIDIGTIAASIPIGEQILLHNIGTAATHVYAEGGYSIDTIAGTTGVTLTNGFSCFFTTTGTASIVSGPRGTISS